MIHHKYNGENNLSTPEGIVLSKCKDILKKLEVMGWICYWNRMEVGIHYNMQGYIQKHGRKGDPDLFAFVPVDNTVYVMFFEVKREDGKGIQSPSQQEFENKWIGLHNVSYTIITEAKQIKELVSNIRRKSKTYGKLEDWELPIDL